MIQTPKPEWLTPDLEMLADTAARFAEKEMLPNDARWREQKHGDRALWNKAGAAGLLCASIPEQYGGGGGDFRHDMVILQTWARQMAGGFSNSVHSGIVAQYLLRYGTEAQKQHYLPKMATGECVAAIAMTEPGAGTDLQAIRTRAVKEGGDYVINGSKIFITNGHHADLVVLVCRTGEEKGGKGVSLVLVDASTKGFRRGKLLDKVGQHTVDTAELFFEDMRVPQSQLLGTQEGRGFVQLMEELPRERLIIAAGGVATLQRAIADTVAYVKQRSIFGQTLMSMQNTRFKLAECQMKASIAESFVNDLVARSLRGELDLPTSAIAKCWVSDAVCQVVDECVQLHGGYGYMMEYPIARLYADTRVGRIYGGSNEVMKELIARAMEK
ncbi:acyl-CoA dehydrogenase family protein [Aquabacterium sp. OR-4]|uniref:acyl-CoA dehydrogenase family protein n=1 Tax=Aquabacterium sp. OR-4 TaxID=2978127 RepID=UPI0021B2DC7A|nr:acyl-CoA dehydrogenase family protein [Aquabacterium sp. OR-4]MDT7837367.1 acyl-CoA dehydrogenase family protein [Aquabacterium sp. OR-4]